MNTRRLHELADAWRDGSLSEPQAAELSQMLRDSEEARRYFRVEARMHGLLHWVVAAAAVGQTALSRSLPVNRPAARALFLRFQWLPLAAAVLMVGVVWWTRGEWREDAPAESISTLVFADRCEWASTNAPREGQRLPAGPLRLRKGTAVIRFDGGAAAIIVGQTDLEVRSRGSALLHRGEVVVRASGQAAGFILKTPASDVLDLGTEFAVKVEDSGATEIHTLEGLVAYRKPVTLGERYGEPDSESVGELLPAGRAVRYDTIDAATPRSVSLEAKSFEELLVETKPTRAPKRLIAHEPFDYPDGPLPLVEANGGDGWAGPWHLRPGRFDLSSLNIALDPSTAIEQRSKRPGAWVESFNVSATFFRRFNQPIQMDRNGVYYISVRVHWESASTQPPSQSRTLFALRASADIFGEYIHFRLPAHLLPQIEHGLEEIVNGTASVPINETQLWVAKIVSRKQGSDEIFFRIYREGEVPGWIEPATWSVRANIRSDAHFDTLLISAGGRSKRWFGDVRVGTNWRSVLPTAEAYTATR